MFSVLIGLIGCADNSLPGKNYDPEAVATAVLATFDKDGDGKLDEDELQACLPLQSARDRIDKNQDGALDASEISNRVSAYAPMSEYIVAQVAVKRGTRPVSGATLTMGLADYMRGVPTKFTATTNSAGIGMPQSSPESLLGFPPGFYDVEIVHEGKTWDFGVEMADDNPTVNQLEFDLKEK